jgi:hypothetical protein
MRGKEILKKESSRRQSKGDGETAEKGSYVSIVSLALCPFSLI